MAHIIADRVKESTSTTGTSAFVTTAALTGHRRLSAVCAVGDTLRYQAQAVDSNGAPSGDWEVGIGTYSAANTLERTQVLFSSNANALVNFAAGTKHVWIGMDATLAGMIREKLTATRTYYVRTDGNDSNTGLADTAGGAFLTIQKAIDTICKTLDTNGFAVTIQVADGTYTGGAIFRGKVGVGNIYLTGNATTPANCTISTTSADCVYAGIDCTYTVLMTGFRLQTTGGGSCIHAAYGATIMPSVVTFHTCAEAHTYAHDDGKIFLQANYSITGNAIWHHHAHNGGRIVPATRTVTVSASLTFTIFAYAENRGQIDAYSMTYSTTTATGKKHEANRNSVIFTNTGAAITFPGSTGGSTAYGGQIA